MDVNPADARGRTLGLPQEIHAASRRTTTGTEAAARPPDRGAEVSRGRSRPRERPKARTVPLQRMIAELNPLLRGWAGYFGLSQMHELPSLDGWIRRRLRCAAWIQWKTRPRRFDELRRL